MPDATTAQPPPTAELDLASYRRALGSFPTGVVAGIGLSVLTDHHGAACRRLAGPVPERFRGLPLRHCRSGAILIEDAVATFECRRVEEVPAGDHVIAILESVRFSTAPMAAPPLVHHRGALATVAGVP
jgi:flavin reductase (DIM6/NTAB) family NADH-FMN oxidoreductase RutF